MGDGADRLRSRRSGSASEGRVGSPSRRGKLGGSTIMSCGPSDRDRRAARPHSPSPRCREAAGDGIDHRRLSPHRCAGPADGRYRRRGDRMGATGVIGTEGAAPRSALAAGVSPLARHHHRQRRRRGDRASRSSGWAVLVGINSVGGSIPTAQQIGMACPPSALGSAIAGGGVGAGACGSGCCASPLRQWWPAAHRGARPIVRRAAGPPCR